MPVDASTGVEVATVKETRALAARIDRISGNAAPLR